MKKNIGFVIIPLLLFWAVMIFFCQYLLQIPFNLHSGIFLLELGVLWAALAIAFVLKGIGRNKKLSLFHYLLFLPLVILFLLSLVGSPYTGGLKNYQNQSNVREIDFQQIEEFDVTQIQLVDKNTAQQLGDRVFGTLGSEEVSQYEIGDDWVQISVNGTLYRVTPINFGGLFKFLATRTTPGYIMVDCETGEAKLIRTEGLKYMTSAYFHQNLYRHLFFKDPFALLGKAKFELDDSMKPYWVVPVYDVTWIGKTRDVKGVYVVDPFTGDADYYPVASVPAWVDNIYPVSVVYRQFAQSKRYENGLFNWSKKGIVEFTDDYAYVQFNQNVWIYTGVTSVGKDESNVGFAYIDLRNGDVSYIRMAGAEEYSARSSAEGSVQQYGYKAIFPSMVNVKGRPTYFMGLVDSANLIKSYSFVNYENYQIVATGSSVEEAYSKYLKLLGETDTGKNDNEVTQTWTFTVKGLNSIVRDGNTIFLLLDEQDVIRWYDVSNGDLMASFLAIGDQIIAETREDGEIVKFLEISHPIQTSEE